MSPPRDDRPVVPPRHDDRPVGTVPAGRPLAIVVARSGQLPRGGDEAVAEAGGLALVVGSGAEEAAGALTAAEEAWWCDTGPGLRAGALASSLAELVRAVPLVILPASPDGRDLAPRLAAALDRPLLAQAVAVTVDGDRGGPTSARLSRLDDRALLPVQVAGPAVATLVPGVRAVTPVPGTTPRQRVELAQPDAVLDPEVLEVLEPDPATMDLGDATRVLAGGAGLVGGHGGAGGDLRARALFDLLGHVAGALGASAGATRVATDAGWIGYERQIGTTGVAVDPELYLALGVSGATQHTGGLGAPRHIVSVNTDPSCPMTAMADLGLVTDAGDLLVALARRFDVPVPDQVLDARADDA